ncbi:MAG: ShlB/FhaC/HecB family hemolysin secretion/activation protein [Myxococcota bacterium]
MRVRRLARAASLLAVTALFAAPARASFNPTDPPAGDHTQSDGPRYWIGRVYLAYANEHPLQPPIALLVGADYALGQASDGYVGARRGGKNVWFHLGELGVTEPVPVYATGLQDLCEQIVEQLGERGMMGVYVAPSPADIDADTGGDVRPQGSTELHLVVHTGRVQAVRTFRAPELLAAAAPAADQESDDRESIAARSPLQPVGAGDPLDKNKLDAYLADLNRLPGRMVDAVLTPTLTPGVVNLDYLVAEDRPWTISSDYSNTGTDSTGKNRQHFAFANYQLTGRDDSLLVDYTTSDFANTNSVSGSYEGRMPFLDGTRWRVGGDWSEYSSDQFGAAIKFSGTQWDVNGTLLQRLIAEPGFFVDAYFGTRWMNVDFVNIDTSFGHPSMPFFVPALGVTLDRSWSTTRLHARLGFEQSVPAIAGTSSSDMQAFSDGTRADLDSNWRILSLDLGGSVYLQPWFHGTRFYDVRALRPREMTQELAWRFSGQSSLGTRVIPQVEGVLGGAATVRGYPQSVVSGDSFVNSSLEYRYHIPLALRGLAPLQVPWLGPFRLAPDDSLRMPDWDLVLCTFADYGRVMNANEVLGEHNDSLASLGVGVEIIVRRNFSLRLDYGFALLEIPQANVSVGNGEAHFAALMRY